MTSRSVRNAIRGARQASPSQPVGVRSIQAAETASNRRWARRYRLRRLLILLNLSLAGGLMLAGVWTSWRLTATGLILGAAMHGVLRIPE